MSGLQGRQIFDARTRRLLASFVPFSVVPESVPAEQVIIVPFNIRRAGYRPAKRWRDRDALPEALPALRNRKYNRMRRKRVVLTIDDR